MPQHVKRVSGGQAPQLNFPVTDAQIASAVPADSAHCMIADGLKAAVPHARGVTVDLATIRYTDSRNGRRYIHLTPPEAQYALLQFDHGIKPKAFVVKNHAVQIIEPPPGRRKPKGKEEERQLTLDSPSISVTVEPTRREDEMGFSPSISEAGLTSVKPAESQAPEDEPRLYRRATVIPNPAGGGTIPIKLNGSPPPLGPLATGKGSQQSDLARRTGRIRKFGLRVMGRIELPVDEATSSEDVVD